MAPVSTIVAVVAACVVAVATCAVPAHSFTITAPVLPQMYASAYDAFSGDGGDKSISRVWYDWPSKRMASNHTACISGNYAVSHAPCAIVMHNDVTSCVSAEVEGGCCIYPDTIGVGIPAPNAFTFWHYKGNITFQGTAAYLFMLDNFQWILNAETLQPLRFRFGGSLSYFDYTSPIVPLTEMPTAPFDVPPNCTRKCPFKFA